MKKLLCGLMVLLVGVGLSQTKGLLAADRFDVVDKHMQAGLENQLYPGAQLLIMQHNKLVFYKNYGALHYGPEAPLVTDSSIYDVASLTKVMVTLPLVLKLLEAKPDCLELILTGRDAPQSFIDKADLVTEMKLIKHYFYEGEDAREGLDY